LFEYLSPLEAACAVADTPQGVIRSVCGVSAQELFSLVDQRDFGSPASHVLFVEATAANSAEAFVEDILSCMADTALKVWPAWYKGSGIDFGICPNDALGRRAMSVLARKVSKKVPGVQPIWTEKAALAALRGRLSLIELFSLRAQLEQLTKAFAPDGLVLVLSPRVQQRAATAEAYVHALEWLAQSCGVVTLFDDLPANEPPFERVLEHACMVRTMESQLSPDEKPARPWIAPWRGSPHPTSEIEKKMAAVLAADQELGYLFAFNQTVATARGSQPKVDILWSEGRLVVELDGYESHGGRSAFVRDRHRDYELMVSGYVVLRLANDEIAQDCEKALEKIRDLVCLRRQAMIEGGLR
jgi:very-short-patch-repair endonuclease